MSTDIQDILPAMIDNVRSLDQEALEMELSFAQGFAPPEDLPAYMWLILLAHETRSRGVFVPDATYATIEDWMLDSDYLWCDGTSEECDEACGWVNQEDVKVDALDVYQGAYETYPVEDVVAVALDFYDVAS